MIEGKVENISALDNIVSRLFLRQKEYELMVQTIAHDIKIEVDQRLAGIIGPNQAKHFQIDVYGNQYGSGFKITVDQLGSYLYFGTQPHTEIAHNIAMSLPEGYVHEVMHPGQKPLQDQIDAAVNEIVDEVVRLSVDNLRY